jgi:hypothetical protein
MTLRHEEIVRLLRADMDRATNAMRQILARKMYAPDAGAFVRRPPLTRWQRVRQGVRRYVGGWREALRACGRALCGRDVWPDDGDDW